MPRVFYTPGGPAAEVQSVLKSEEALKLRGEGLTYIEIGRRMGTGKVTAFRRVQRAIQRHLAEPAAHVQQLELQRLDRMFDGLVRKGAFDGDPKAVMSAVRVMDQRAKLLGLYAPEKREDTVTLKSEAARNELLGRLARLAAAGQASGDRTEPQPN